MPRPSCWPRRVCMSRAWSGMSARPPPSSSARTRLASSSLERSLADSASNRTAWIGEQPAVVAPGVEALPSGVQGDDHGDRLRIAEADVLDGDHVEAVPQVACRAPRLVADKSSGAQHGVAHVAAPDRLLQRRDHLVGGQARGRRHRRPRVVALGPATRL